jgi:hypothetical protein
MKALSINRVAIPLDQSLFKLDIAFFEDCYIFFHERTLPLMQFAQTLKRSMLHYDRSNKQ